MHTVLSRLGALELGDGCTMLAGPTRGGCFMSNPPQCRPQPGSLG